MGWLQSATTQITVWSAYTRLGADEDDQRNQAMETLRAAGNASLPCLRYALKQTSKPRVRFAAAVVLHRLGEPEGMATLLEALQWRLQASPFLSLELENAFIAIGSPDAVTALLDLWYRLPDWGENQLAMASICRIWAVLRDPRALDGLVTRATRIPDLFERTVPAFGEMAVVALRPMVAEPHPDRRALAIRALRHITSGRAFTLLVPLLRDPDPDVRATVPEALERCGGASAAAQAITEALQAGYSTRAAIDAVIHIGPVPYHALRDLVARWNPHSLSPTGDTAPAVLAAIKALVHAPWPNAQFLPTLCDLLARRPDAVLTAAAAQLIGVRGLPADPTAPQAREALWPLISHADATVRAEAAESLSRLGEPVGKQIVQLVQSCRPQGSLLNKLQAILRGGPDVGQAASQAVLQVSQWLTRVSKETVERLATPGAGSPALADTRVPASLKQLLANGLQALEQAATPEETEELMALCVAALRALSRNGASTILLARSEVLGALLCVKRSLVYEDAKTQQPFRKSEMREVADVVRAAAVETLLLAYNEASFPLFLELLYSPLMEIQATGLMALGRLGDVRALSHLQAFLTDGAHPLAAAAQEAISAIRRTNPEMMTLLRGSMPNDPHPETLLRPASGVPNVSSEHLLRPTAPQSLSINEAQSQ